jgi:hypothetical protein
MRVLKELLNLKTPLIRALQIANAVGAQARDSQSDNWIAFGEYAAGGSCTLALRGLDEYLTRTEGKDFQRVTLFNIAEHRQIVAEEFSTLLIERSEAA